MKKIIVAGLILLIIVAGAASLKYKKSHSISASNSNNNRVIKVVTLQNADEGLFIKDFAQEKGYFAKRNLKIESSVVDKNGGDLLLKGAGDVYLGGIAGTLYDFFNGLDFKWIATTTTHPYNMGAISRFPKGEEQKIKKVAITRFGGANELQVRDALHRIGVDASKVDFVVTPIESRAALMDAGQIDFTVVDLDMSGKSDASKIFQKYTIYNPVEAFTSGVAVRGITTTTNVINTKKSELQDFVSGIQEALNYADTHHNEVVSFLQKNYDFSSDNAEKFYANYLEARKGASFAPSADMVKDAVGIMKQSFKFTAPERDVNKFEFADFANNTQGK